jgi:predicted TIM-barrel fold metal-dependent hydrolase
VTTLAPELTEAELADTRFISADSHVVEDPALWKDVLAPDHWGQLESSFGQKQGAYDAEDRVPAMAVDGVSAEVLYPSLAMQLFTLDPEPQAECFHRYNEWLASFCAVAPDRLIGIGLIPTYDMDGAVDEVRWCDAHGLRGVQIWQSPHPDLPFTSDHYDRFWAEAAARSLPVSLHAITGFDHSRALFQSMKAGDVGDGVSFYRVTNHCLFSVMDSLLDLLFSGTLDRYPDLKVVLVENEVGWLPFALDQWDFFFGEFAGGVGRGVDLQRLPSESFREHVYATFLTEGNVAPVAAQIGAGNIMWSNDYPHGMSTWPHSRERVRTTLAGLETEELAAVLGGNVRSLYQIEIAPTP